MPQIELNAESSHPKQTGHARGNRQFRSLDSSFESPSAFLELIHGHCEAKGKVAWARGRGDGFKNFSPAPFDEVAKAFSELKGEEDIYLCLHRFWGRKRQVDAVGQLQAFHVDIDYYKAPSKRHRSLPPKLAALEVLRQLEDQAIPAPSFMLLSGKGLLAVWMIKPVPARRNPHETGAIRRWRQIQDKLHLALKPLGADTTQKHCAAICRVPGTVNSKYGKPAEVVWIHSNGIEKRTLDDIAAELLPSRKPTAPRKAERATSSRPTSGRSYRNLHYERLLELRRWALNRTEIEDGHRDSFLFCAACSLAWLVAPVQLENAIVAFAQDTGLIDIDGWSRYRVLQVTRSVVARAHEDASGAAGIGSDGQGRYQLRSETILERLPITAEEARALQLVHLNPDPQQKANHRRKQDRERQQRRRRGKGQTSRADYEANSVTQQKPWAAAGMARSTWYKKGLHRTSTVEGERSIAGPEHKARKAS